MFYTCHSRDIQFYREEYSVRCPGQCREAFRCRRDAGSSQGCPREYPSDEACQDCNSIYHSRHSFLKRSPLHE